MRAEHPPRGWYPYLVLFVSLFLIVTGSGSVYFTVAALKPIAADFGWARSVPSLALAFQYLGGGLAGVAMGYWLDRAGMARPACVGAILLGLGALLTYWVREAWQLYFICGVLMACAGPVTLFSTLTVNIQRWFEDRRGMAVGVIGGGQALAGAIWPLTFQSGIEAFGWRNTAFLYGVFVLLVMVPLSIVFLRPHPRPARVRRDGNRSTEPSTVPAPVAPGVLLLMLSLASIGCCVAMSLPIAHLLSHASDVGYTPADGARMISLMLLCAAASSMLVLGRVVARVGPLAALLVFSSVQALTLSLFPSAHSLFELYVVAICFGLGYGGVLPCYPLIVRQFLSPHTAGAKTAIVIGVSTVGMALGSGFGGLSFDLAGSYAPAFYAGSLFNLGNLGIIFYLRRRVTVVRRLAVA